MYPCFNNRVCHCERSEAIQFLLCDSGLLRRFAPRNDGESFAGNPGYSSLSPGSYSASRPMRSRQSSAVQGSISEPQRLSR